MRLSQENDGLATFIAIRMWEKMPNWVKAQNALDDLVQEARLAMLLVEQKFNEEHERANFSAYAAVAIRRRLMRLGRKGVIPAPEGAFTVTGRQQRPGRLRRARAAQEIVHLGDTAFDVASKHEDPSAEAGRREIYPLALGQVYRLPPMQRAILLRHYGLAGFREMSTREIAADLGTSSSSVKELRRRAKASVRNWVKKILKEKL